MSDLPPYKRARSTREPTPVPASELTRPRSLNDVPLELLAAILDNLATPRDLLAVCRTSSHLCHTLLHPSNQAIWHRARVRCPAGPVPNPPADRKEDYLAAVDEYNKGIRDPTYVAKDRSKQIARLAPLIEHSHLLANFRDGWESMEENVELSSHLLLEAIARERGWVTADFLATPTLQRMLSQARACLEPIQQDHITPILSKLRHELVVCQAKRETSLSERQRQTHQTDIKAAYRRLVKSPPRDIVIPSLAEFRRFHIIQALQAKNARSIAEELREEGVIWGLVVDALQRWTSEAKKGLAEVLGFGRDWADPSYKAEHIVLRLDARFECRKCADAGSLDFAGACAHVCVEKSACPGKNGKEQEPWNAGNFVCDARAIDIVRTACRLAEIPVAEKVARMRLEAVGVRWKCGHCPAGIVMPFSRLVRRPLPSPLPVLA
ncbi:hypothetical protein K488DRAFT_83009 [Vararia minispora EC-137]|uniref:Uncharacterized protein n=1 Tax=Vararia minispora EC-137 TaxID=1314806 RepID=A0ACB8QUR7_9AGAM|nr:hypothetical protein K488DRAFT_83009 [Vararia minispora EC-137]